MLEKAPGAPKLGYLVPERYSPISKERPLPRELPRGSHREAPASAARFAPDTAEPGKRPGFFDTIADWGIWGGRAILTHVVKWVGEFAIEAPVYIGSIYLATFLSKLALFAPLVAGLGSFFVPAASFVIATSFFTSLNFGLFKGYDRLKTDVLGYERIKQLRKYWWFRWFVDPVIFLGLCIHDPFDATIYAREGSEKYNGLSGRDWRNFTVATIISNAFWLSGIGSVLKFFSLV